MAGASFLFPWASELVTGAARWECESHGVRITLERMRELLRSDSGAGA